MNDEESEIREIFGDDTVERLPWFPAALKVLEHATLGDRQAAHDRFVQMHREFGSHCVAGAVLSWIDIAMSSISTTDDHKPVRLEFVRSETGASVEPEEVPPWILWSGRLFAARLANDPDMYGAIWSTIDPDKGGTYISHVLDVAASMLREEIASDSFD